MLAILAWLSISNKPQQVTLIKPTLIKPTLIKPTTPEEVIACFTVPFVYQPVGSIDGY